MGEIIDMHFHLVGNGEGTQGDDRCYISPAMQSSSTFKILKFMTGFCCKKLSDPAMLKHLLKTINESKAVSRAVFLAMDKVYDRDTGSPDMGKTQLYVPNRYAAQVARENDNVLYGASVHPYDPNAVERLDQAKADGAVLVKWLPSAQGIDPKDDKCVPFYAKLKELGLPLLSHTGNEHTILCAGGDESLQRYNHPERLEKALEKKVTVIAAHCGLPVRRKDADYLDTIKGQMKKHDTLYADLSGMFVPIRKRIRAIDKALTALPHDRLLFGVDYPILVNARTPMNLGVITRRQFDRIRHIKNPLDLTLEILRAMGAEEDIFTRAAQLLPIT